MTLTLTNTGDAVLTLMLGYRSLETIASCILHTTQIIINSYSLSKLIIFGISFQFQFPGNLSAVSSAVQVSSSKTDHVVATVESRVTTLQVQLNSPFRAINLLIVASMHECIMVKCCAFRQLIRICAAHFVKCAY